MQKILRLFHTVKYLKPVQVYGRLWFRLYRPKPDMASAPAIRPVKGDWISPCKKPSSFFSPCTFKFLNVVHELKPLHDWNKSEWEKLWIYNLHYFDDLGSCDAENKKELHADLIEKWIQENPPGSGNGWEPYPISLRIVNWIKWSLDGNCLSDEALNSLAVQVRYLSKRLEFHLLGNHLFANAKALVFAGLFFCGREAETWLQRGLRILDKQVKEQVLEDGGHFELTPMYHSIILEDLLDLVNVTKTYNVYKVPEIWTNSVPKMMNWLEQMCHPDGQISFFNDAALGIAPELRGLKAYAGRLGFNEIDSLHEGACELASSGYVRLQKGRAVLIADVGRIGVDYLPGHSHADTLSFELSLQGQRIFVNSGISCYGNSRERLVQRGTACHNTLMLDGKNSSEVWAGFRVAQRAYPLGLEKGVRPDGALRIKCGHDGYKRLKGRPVHWREWVLEDDCLEIKDQVMGGRFQARVFYHLYPGADVDLKERKIVIGDVGIIFLTDAAVELKDTCFYPEFGKSIPNKCLVLKPLTDKCHMKFTWSGK
jgi:uncharacterized heparinase superfamily protein